MAGSRLKAAETSTQEENQGEVKRYCDYDFLFTGLNEVEYHGEWGDTLSDFFRSGCDGSTPEFESFVPLAVSLSEGQRSSLELLPMYSLLMTGLVEGEELQDLFPDVDELFDDYDESESISVYSGINRGIFREGIAMTSEAIREMSKGSIPDYYTEKKELSTAAFVSLLVTGAICMAVGIRLAARLHYLAGVYNYYKVYKEYRVARDIFTNEELQIGGVNYQAAKKAFLKRDGSLLYSTGMPLCISLTCIGIGLIVGGIIAKFQKTVEYSDAYYHREFSAIPTMIVDEKDLVTTEFEDGELKRSIQFDQYAYYEAVRCNRQEVGALSKWQKGVDKYEEAGCGDVADLNADHGLEWLALYTVKAGKRGDLPILADSLKLIYSDQKRPGTITPSLHFFGETGAADLADRAYCYHNDKGRIYFTWGV